MDKTINMSEGTSNHNWSRSIIAAMKRVKGTAWLGMINGGGKRTIWEWNSGTIAAVQADFVLPCYDAELDAMLSARYKGEYMGVENDTLRIQAILARIEKLGGQLLDG